jgi:protein-disulfide isomerase
MKPRCVAAIGILAVFALAGFTSCGGDDSTAASNAPGTPRPSATPKPTTTGNAVADALAKLNYLVDLENGRTLGKVDAPVTIQMFEDFTCPHCLEFTATIEPSLIDQFVKAGRVKLEFHYFPLRQSSVGPMVAAECASQQNRFWEYGERLFKEQAIADALPSDQLGDGLAKAFGQDSLVKYAADLGLDATRFNACLASDAVFDPIQADARTAEEKQMPGTPTFVINGNVLLNGSPSSLNDWKKLIDATK